MWIMVLIAVSQGSPPIEYRYAFQDEATCLAAMRAAIWTDVNHGIGFAKACVPGDVKARN